MRNTDYTDLKGRLHRFKRQIILLVTGYWLLVSGAFAQQKTELISAEERLQNAQKYYAAGKELIRQGNFSAANLEFKKAQNLLRASPSEAHLSQAPAPRAEGQLKSPPLEAADLHYNQALAYLKTKKYREAADALIKVIQLNPKDKDAHYNLGVLYESYLNDKKKALYYYAQYIKYGKGKEDTGEVKQWILQLKKELKQ